MIGIKNCTNFNFQSEKCSNPPSCQNDGFLTSACSCQCPQSISGIYCESFISHGKINK